MKWFRAVKLNKGKKSTQPLRGLLQVFFFYYYNYYYCSHSETVLMHYDPVWFIRHWLISYRMCIHYKSWEFRTLIYDCLYNTCYAIITFNWAPKCAQTRAWYVLACPVIITAQVMIFINKPNDFFFFCHYVFITRFITLLSLLTHVIIVVYFMHFILQLFFLKVHLGWVFRYRFWHDYNNDVFH